MMMSDTMTETPFRRWLDDLEIDTKTAAALLGKTPRMIENYERGHAPPLATRKLMRVLFERRGRDISPWPVK